MPFLLWLAIGIAIAEMDEREVRRGVWQGGEALYRINGASSYLQGPQK